MIFMEVVCTVQVDTRECTGAVRAASTTHVHKSQQQQPPHTHNVVVQLRSCTHAALYCICSWPAHRPAFNGPRSLFGLFLKVELVFF